MTDTALWVPTDAHRIAVDASSRPRGVRRWRFRESLLLAVVWIALTWTVDFPLLGYLVAAVAMVLIMEMFRRRGVRGQARDTRLLHPLSRSLRVGRMALLVGAIASLIVHALVVEDAWADSGAALLAGSLLGAVAYLASRRLFVTLLVVTVLLAGASFALAPRLATERDGDQGLLSQLADLQGYHRLSVVAVDLQARQTIRHADIGGTETDPFEVGSMTKAMTGLVMADQVRRGELQLTDRLSAYLPVQGTGCCTERAPRPSRTAAPSSTPTWVLPWPDKPLPGPPA